MNQKEAWEQFYNANNRPWRGMSRIKNIPFPKGSKILEEGCGNGKTVSMLLKMGYHVTGIDFSQSAINACKHTFSDSNTAFICGLITELPFDNNTFDGATVIHVLEHLDSENLVLAISELKRVLKNGSRVFVRCFEKGDMRSEKGVYENEIIVRGNGIMYRYFDSNELHHMFKDYACESITTYKMNTRFGTIRKIIDAIFIA